MPGSHPFATEGSRPLVMLRKVAWRREWAIDCKLAK